jgi:replicative DNA helicase
LHKNYGAKLYTIADLDYLHDGDKTFLSRSQELSYCLKRLKKLAIKLSVALVLGGELESTVNDNATKRAELLDLKYYPLLKPLVSNYYFVYRDYDLDILKTDEGLDTENLVEVHVFSRMHGQSVIPLTFFEHSGRLEDKMVTK